LSSVRADIAEDAATPSRMLRSKRAPDNKEVVTTMEDDRRIQLVVSLEQKK